MPRCVPAMSSSVDFVPPTILSPPGSRHRTTAATATTSTTSATRRLPCPASAPRIVEYEKFLRMPFSIHTRALQRQAFAVERLREQIRIRRIGVDRHALVGDLLAELRAAAASCENVPRPSSAARALNAPPSSGTRSATACGSSTTVYIPGSIAVGLRMRRLSAPRRAQRGRVDRAPVARAADAHPDPVPSGVRTVVERFASVDAMIREQSLRSSRCARAPAFASRNPATNTSPAALPSAPHARSRASLRRREPRAPRSAVVSMKLFDRRVRLRAELRHDLRIFRGQLRETLGEIDRALERCVVEHVRRRRRAALADRAHDGDGRVGRAAATS